MPRKEYRSEGVTVTFDPRRCIHSADCINGLPEVFDVEKRPWVNPENSDPDTVAEVVTQCPTGALQFVCRGGGPEEPVPGENVVTVAENGPLYARGDIEIKEHDGTTLLEDTRVAFCRCGESRNKPFCDNSHENSGFRDEGFVEGDSSEGSSGEAGGRLDIKLTPNGPLFVKGELEIRGVGDAEGPPSRRESRVALCRCGYSGSKPFCDGSHGGIGWRDD